MFMCIYCSYLDKLVKHLPDKHQESSNSKY